MSKSKEVTQTPTTSTLPTDVEQIFKEFDKELPSFSQDDLALPYLTILQNLSPQVRKTQPEFVEGACEGDIFHTVLNKVLEPPIKVTFCGFSKLWVEWIPRDSGGGWVQNHLSEQVMNSTTKNELGFDVLPNGHVIVPTYYYFTYLHDYGHVAILSMSRTQMKSGRQLNALIQTSVVKVGDKSVRVPIFAQRYTLAAKPRSNAKGEWFVWDIAPDGVITSGDVLRQMAQIYRSTREMHIESLRPEPSEASKVTNDTVDGDEVPF